MIRKTISLTCATLLSLSLPAFAGSSTEYCGRTPIYEISDEVPPLDFDIYAKGNFSNWGTDENYRFDYKGNNVYQMRASFSSGDNYKLASDSWSDEFWVATPSGENGERQGLRMGQEYALNWISDGTAANTNFATGDLLFTVELVEGAKKGDEDAAFLSISACDEEQQKLFGKTIGTGYKINVATTLASAIGANDAVSIGPDGHIYVSDFGVFGAAGVGTGETIVRVSPTGEQNIFVEGLTGPLGQHWDSEGNLYVINASNGASGQLLRISPEGEKTLIAEVAGFPTNVVEDKEGSFYVANFSSTVLTKIDELGNQTPFADHPDLYGIVGMVYDSKYEIIIGANYINGKIVIVDAYGHVNVIAHIPSGIGYMTTIGRTIYATGIFSNRVYQVSFNGNIKLIGGSGDPVSQDGITSKMQFNLPNGIAADPINKILYISEFGGDHNLRAIQLR